jgi:hypothetical protein
MQIRRRLSYANVMSTAAVFLAIAGGSTAIAITVNASKKSDINKKGNIRAGRVGAKELADGTVAASKLARIEVVTAQSGFTSSQANCAPGDVLMGGGAQAAGGQPLAASVPSPQGNAWIAGSGGNGTIAYALCLRNTSGP